jgi:hypothetical protein
MLKLNWLGWRLRNADNSAAMFERLPLNNMDANNSGLDCLLKFLKVQHNFA